MVDASNFIRGTYMHIISPCMFIRYLVFVAYVSNLVLLSGTYWAVTCEVDVAICCTICLIQGRAMA